MKLVTIGLPVYNADRYLKAAIRSILNQTYQGFELIIVDDGSSDRSVEIINGFKDPRIVFIRDGKNLGLPKRLNQISSLTKTKFLMRMDADDIMVSNRVEKQIEFLEQNPDVDVLGSNCYTINNFNEITGKRFANSNRAVETVKSFVHPTIVGKTSWFVKNPYDEHMRRSQDYELWLRTGKRSKFCRLNSPLIYYREVGGEYHNKYFKSAGSKWYVTKKLFNNKNYFHALNIFVRDYLKTLVIGSSYYLFSIFKSEDHLLAHRNLTLSDSEITVAEKMLCEAIS